MSYGVDIRNGSNKITLSSDFPTIKYFGKCYLGASYPGPGAWGSVWSYRHTLYTPIVPNGQIPIVFVNSGGSGGVVVFQLAPLGNGQWRYDIATLHNTPPTCYVFSNGLLPASPDPYGFQIRDSSNQLQFDSGWVKKSILNVQSVPMLTLSGNQIASLGKVFAKPACMVQPHYTWQQDVSPFFTVVYKLAMSCASSSVSLSLLRIQIGNPGYGNYTLADGRYVGVPTIEGADYD